MQSTVRVGPSGTEWDPVWVVWVVWAVWAMGCVGCIDLMECIVSKGPYGLCDLYGLCGLYGLYGLYGLLKRQRRHTVCRGLLVTR